MIGNLTTGRSYRFKVRAINFNGESLDSTEYIFFSCLPPTNIDVPRLVSSTEDTFTVQWSQPRNLNGCPLKGYTLRRNDGVNANSPTTVVDTYEPQIYQDTVTLNIADKGKTYKFTIEGENNAGSVTSGIAFFILANVPATPAIPTNDALVTINERIKVNFGTVLPDNRGSPIIGLQLQMDDGLGGEFFTIVGRDSNTL